MTFNLAFSTNRIYKEMGGDMRLWKRARQAQKLTTDLGPSLVKAKEKDHIAHHINDRLASGWSLYDFTIHLHSSKQSHEQSIILLYNLCRQRKSLTVEETLLTLTATKGHIRKWITFIGEDGKRKKRSIKALWRLILEPILILTEITPVANWRDLFGTEQLLRIYHEASIAMGSAGYDADYIQGFGRSLGVAYEWSEKPPPSPPFTEEQIQGFFADEAWEGMYEV